MGVSIVDGDQGAIPFSEGRRSDGGSGMMIAPSGAGIGYGLGAGGPMGPAQEQGPDLPELIKQLAAMPPMQRQTMAPSIAAMTGLPVDQVLKMAGGDPPAGAAGLANADESRRPRGGITDPNIDAMREQGPQQGPPAPAPKPAGSKGQQEIMGLIERRNQATMNGDDQRAAQYQRDLDRLSGNKYVSEMATPNPEPWNNAIDYGQQIGVIPGSLVETPGWLLDQITGGLTGKAEDAAVLLAGGSAPTSIVDTTDDARAARTNASYTKPATGGGHGSGNGGSGPVRPRARPQATIATDGEAAEQKLNFLQRLAQDKFGMDGDKRDALSRALMMGGAAAMAGRSSNAFTNLGQGAMAGVQAFGGARDEQHQQGLDMAAEGRAQEKHGAAMTQADLTRQAALKKLEAGADPLAGFTDTQAGKMRLAEVLAEGNEGLYRQYLTGILGAEDTFLK